MWGRKIPWKNKIHISLPRQAIKKVMGMRMEKKNKKG